jgi:hypothetical protein
MPVAKRLRVWTVSAALMLGGACNRDSSLADAGSMSLSDAGSTTIASGQLVLCPADAPVGACTTEGLTCQYPAQTCVCASGAWGCTACPTTQPGQFDNCIDTVTGAQLPFQCVYGALTCSCLVVPWGWQCGACPAPKPASDEPCGNTPFTCNYGPDTCFCHAGSWSCSTITCDPATDSTFRNCAGNYACVYPDEDEVCICTGQGPNPSARPCSCPHAMPTPNSKCAVGNRCQYGDQACICSEGSWGCVAACPVDQPANGTTCSSNLNCTYPGGNLCYCMDGTWHC